jgi:hypothetical protein
MSVVSSNDNMPPLEYYNAKGLHIVFENHVIDEKGNITNITTGKAMARCMKNGYTVVTATDTNGKRHDVRVARAIASTFLGKPPTIYHTASYKDKDSKHDVLSNIQWSDDKSRIESRTMPQHNKSARRIVREENDTIVEKTASEWEEALADQLNPTGKKYTEDAIRKYARLGKFGFRYKTYEDLPGEVWKLVAGSNQGGGEWYVSTEGRMKFKSGNIENILSADQLYKRNGYPQVRVNGKQWYCHVLSFMTFNPDEYANRKEDEIVRHKDDDRLDFRPHMLRLGTRGDNAKDAHYNGKYDGTMSAMKPCVSYIDGILEKEHESRKEAVRYLKSIGYSSAKANNIRGALTTGETIYGRTWVNP